MKKAELSAETEAKRAKAEKDHMEKLAEQKLSKFYEEEKEVTNRKGTIIKDIENVDLDKVTIFVFSLGKMIEKGAGEGEVKIPLSLAEKMHHFLGKDSFTALTDAKGKERWGRKISLEVVDTQQQETVMDKEALMYEESKYFAIYSSVLQAMHPEENDLIRLIQKESGYCLELIRQSSQEFEIWDHFCIYPIKNTKRKYGIM